MAKISSIISKYAWVPIPILILAIILAEVAGIDYAKENTLLLLIFNLIFNTFASFLTIYLLSRSFLISGRIGLILFSCAALTWGPAGTLSAIFGNQDPNTRVTIYNLCVFLSSILYFSGAYAWSRQKQGIRLPGLWLTVLYSLTLTVIALVVIFAIRGLTPVFFVEQKGGTALRYYVLIASIVLHVATAIILWISAKDLRLSSLYWYSIALGLISIGLTAVMIQHRLGDFLNWTGRSAQFLGGIYMIIAAFTLARETDIWELSIEFELNSKRKQAEHALIKSEEQFRIMGEVLPYGIWLCDADGKAVYTSRSFLELVNMTFEEMQSRGWLHRMPPEDIGPMVDEWNTCLRTGKDWNRIHRIKDRNGEIKSVLSRGKPVRDENGKIYAWAGINLDVTDRVAAEEHLRLAKDEADRSQQRLKIALENANVGLWEWDFRKNELIWDERAERMFGLAPGTFCKTIEAFEELVNEEDLPRVREAYRNSIEKGTPYEAVFRIRSPKNVYISSRAFVTKDKNGNPSTMHGVIFDVTSFREDTEIAIFKLNQELSRSNKDLQNFAYVASHDLQEPLRMVTSFTQLLQKRYSDKLDDDANTYINYAVEGSKRMYELLNGLLEYSRVSTRTRSFEKVEMSEVIDKVKSNLKIKLDETRATINCSDLPAIMADGNQMIQIMQNLVENGIKFSNRKPVINISAEQKDGFHVFSVRDEGIGIEPQYYERIFRIFQRLHPKEHYAGMGIGLSICQRIVERHGGKIWVESTPGQGSSFYFSIPVKMVV